MKTFNITIGKGRRGRMRKLHRLKTETCPSEVSLVAHGTCLRVIFRPFTPTKRRCKTQARVTIRVELTQQETDFAVADLAQALGYEVVTPVRELPTRRLSFWGSVTNGDTALYMTLNGHKLRTLDAYSRIVVPLSRRRAQTMLNKIADPLGWDLYKD